MDTYQSAYAQFWDNIKIIIHTGKISIYHKDILKHTKTLNKKIQDYTVNATNFINEMAVGGIENFNKSIDLTQRYYNNIVQNNVNYAQKIERL